MKITSMEKVEQRVIDRMDEIKKILTAPYKRNSRITSPIMLVYKKRRSVSEASSPLWLVDTPP